MFGGALAFCACGELASKRLRVSCSTLAGVKTSEEQVDTCDHCAARIRAAAMKAVPPPRKAKKIQASFEGMAPARPAREQSMAEAWYQLFEEARAAKIEGFGGNPLLSFSRPSEVAINAMVQRWMKECGGDEDLCADVLGAYVGEFLRDPWAASLTPPFPWRALFSEKIWGPRFTKILAELKDAQEPN